jgi:hypothetical protein
MRGSRISLSFEARHSTVKYTLHLSIAFVQFSVIRPTSLWRKIPRAHTAPHSFPLFGGHHPHIDSALAYSSPS